MMELGAIAQMVTAVLSGGGLLRSLSIPLDRLILAGLLAIVSALLVTAALGGIAAALWLWWEPAIGTVWATLAVAVILLAFGLGMLTLIRCILRSPCQVSRPQVQSPEKLLEDALQLFKTHKSSVLLAAVLAGIVSARKER